METLFCAVANPDKIFLMSPDKLKASAWINLSSTCILQLSKKNPFWKLLQMSWKFVWTPVDYVRVDCAGRHRPETRFSWSKTWFLIKKPGSELRWYNNILLWRYQFVLSRARWSGVLVKPTRAIDSEHKEKCPYKISVHLKHFQVIWSAKN
jgi:hypothetical protein